MKIQFNDAFIKYYIMLFILMLISFGCGDKSIGPEENITYNRGDVISSDDLGTLSSSEIQQSLSSANVNIPFSLLYSVTVKSITYSTVDKDGNQVNASGALMIPSGINNLPLISLQHGTESKRNLVASQSPFNSTEGAVGLVYASLGYVIDIPDYLGFGVSQIAHPYMHANSLVPSVVDFMRAARLYCTSNSITLNGKIFLTGYSEGGYVTLATQRKIELEYSQEFNLTAVAPLSGPYDFYETSQQIFQSAQYNTPAYIAYILTAYNNLYGWNRLNDIFNAPYSSRVQNLFDGSKTWGEIVNQLPSTFALLMNPAFVTNVNNGNEISFIAALQENTLLDWNPKAPIHFFHGDADADVPYQNALTAIAILTANGGTNIQLTTLSGGTHESSGPAEAMGAIQWFQSF